MNYRQGRNNFSRDRNIRPLFIFLLAILATVLYLWGSYIFSGIGKGAKFLAYPFIKSNTYLSNKSEAIGVYFASKKKLASVNKQLFNENERLKNQLLARKNLEQENIELKDKLGLISKIPQKPILSSVLSRPDQTPYDILFLDGGANRGILKGQKVFLDSEIILGQIIESDRLVSKVKLFSSFGEKIPVAVGPNNIPAIASGLGGGNFYITLPKGVDIRKGDAVKTTIIGSYILGYISRIDEAPENPFKKIYFKSPISLFDLKWVLIIN